MGADDDIEKVDSLRSHGALNPRPERVRDEEFLGSDFFDARDFVQVKYEMLRRVAQQGHTVTQAAAAFGLTRTTFYQSREALEQHGIGGLLARRPGPRGAHKVTDEVLDLVEQLLAEDEGISSKELAHCVNDRLGVVVHPRSIERGLARRQKKRPKGTDGRGSQRQ